MTELLKVRDLTVEVTDRGTVTNRPVRGIDLDLTEGEILGLVGETGCGKSLTGLAILGHLPQGVVRSGDVSIASSPDGGDAVAIVFQNPGTAFNPVFTIGSQLTEVLTRHRPQSKAQARAEVLHHLDQVGLPDPLRVYGAYPHELSGGMLQRSMIAMALLRRPRLLILDEPTTALDVTVAKQILDLVGRLRTEFGFAVLLISHNLGVIRDTCDRVAVLYAGRVIETGLVVDVLTTPRHPYTRGLIGALPAGKPRGERLAAVGGTVPGNLLKVQGCAFANRCPFVLEKCLATDPTLESTSAGHSAACLRKDEL
ncbi:ABC transporter ATP-binding protein [Arthrobacter sp. NPDC093128]|uniref:ABC transporter ATP-binding protein n=1 Tax=Arthrobacter sp. NPDC093128 TaxID=3154979 RepID=UPI00342DD73A